MRTIWQLPALGLVSVIEAARVYGSEPLPASAELLGRAVWGPSPFVAAGLLGLLAASLDVAFRSDGLVSALTVGGLALAVVFRWRLGRGLAREDRIVANELEHAFLAVALPAVVAIGAAAGAATVAELWSGAALAEALHLLLSRLGILPVVLVTLAFARGRIASVLQLVVTVWALTFLSFVWQLFVGIVRGFGFSAIGFVLGQVGLAAPDWAPDLSGLGLTSLLYGTLASVAWIVAQDAFSRRMDGEDVDVAGEIWKIAVAALD